MTTRKMIEPRIVKLRFSGVVCVCRSANVQPAMPASAADSPKVTVLTMATCTPMTDAGGGVVAHRDHRPPDAALHQVAHQHVAEHERAEREPVEPLGPALPTRVEAGPAGGVVPEAADALPSRR